MGWGVVVWYGWDECVCDFGIGFDVVVRDSGICCCSG